MIDLKLLSLFMHDDVRHCRSFSPTKEMPDFQQAEERLLLLFHFWDLDLGYALQRDAVGTQSTCTGNSSPE